MRSGLATVTLALSLAVSSALMSGPPARGSADVLLDEGFEAGVEDWVAAGGTLTATSTFAHQGAHSALFSLSAGGATGLIQYQPIPIQPEGVYSLSAFFIKDDPYIESVTLRMRWEDENGLFIDWAGRPAPSDGDEPDWRSLIVEGQSPRNAAFAVILVFVTGNLGGSFYLDDVRLEGPPPLPPTPTPPSADTPSPQPSPTSMPTPTQAASATTTAVPSPTPTARISASLINSGFEEADDGVPSGWQKYGGELTQTSERHRSGGHAGALRSTTESTKWVYQPLTVSPGSAYDFSVYVLLDDPAAREAFLRISWYASDDASGSAVAVSDSPARLTGGDPSFRLLTTGAALAPQAARSARFRIMLAPASSAPATIYLDDASLREVSPDLAATPAPPPASEDEPDVDAAESAGARSQQVHLSTATQSLTRQGESPHPVKVNEVMYDPAPSGDDAEFEWLELYNAGDEPVDLAGWTLSDNSASDTLPSLTLMPRGFAIIAASERIRDAYPPFSGAMVALADGRIGTGLANKGDHLLLRDSSGKLADGVSWGDDETVLSPSVAAIPSGHSIERSPAGRDTDVAADFVDNANPSPGRGIGEQAVAGAAVQRQAAGSSVVYPPPQTVEEASSNLARRSLVSIAAGVVALAVGLSAGLYGRRRFRQWP